MAIFPQHLATFDNPVYFHFSRTESNLSFVQGLSSYEAYQQFPEQVARIQALQDEISGGTTAVLALIFQCKLFVANVGDSRALLCREMPESTLSVEQACNKFFDLHNS